MMTNIDMFCASVLDVIFDMIECGLGVSFDKNRRTSVDFERAKKFDQEDGFFGGFRESHIFRFHGRHCDNGLLLTLEEYNAVCKEEDDSGGGFAIIRIVSIACVRITDK